MAVINEQDIKKIVKGIVEKYAENGYASANPKSEEILLETSARHVHLTSEAMRALFPNETMENIRSLSQPGEFLSDKRVKIVTNFGEIADVAVLGPERKAVQVELSATDCRALKLNAPVNMSGDLHGAQDVMLISKCGYYFAKQSVIIAKAHIHLTPMDARLRGIKDGEHLNILVKSKRPITLDVVARVKDSFFEAIHIDFDEANACMSDKNTKAIILK